GTALLGEAVDALLEVTGATAGWVGLALEPWGSLTFPVRRGEVPEAWLTLQQGQAGAWGLGLPTGPALVNDLPPLPQLGAPPLRCFLPWPSSPRNAVAGPIALRRQPGGFSPAGSRA